MQLLINMVVSLGLLAVGRSVVDFIAFNVLPMSSLSEQYFFNVSLNRYQRTNPCSLPLQGAHNRKSECFTGIIMCTRCDYIYSCCLNSFQDLVRKDKTLRTQVKTDVYVLNPPYPENINCKLDPVDQCVSKSFSSLLTIYI